MMTIWKYEFHLRDGQQCVRVPEGAELHHVHAQKGMVCLWAEVNPHAKTVERLFVVHGTGHPIESGDRYVGTAHINGFVWHLFEVH